MARMMTTWRDKMGDVPTPDELAAQAEAVRRVKNARIERDRIAQMAADSSEQLQSAIMEALAMGAAVGDVAEAAEVSRQWVFKLRRQRER